MSTRTDYKVHSSKPRARQNWGGSTSTGPEIVVITGGAISGMYGVFWRLAGVWRMVADPMTRAQYDAWDRVADRPTDAMPHMQDWLTQTWRERHDAS